MIFLAGKIVCLRSNRVESLIVLLPSLRRFGGGGKGEKSRRVCLGPGTRINQSIVQIEKARKKLSAIDTDPMNK
jgi:hypothetical protein